MDARPHILPAALESSVPIWPLPGPCLAFALLSSVWGRLIFNSVSELTVRFPVCRNLARIHSSRRRTTTHSTPTCTSGRSSQICFATRLLRRPSYLDYHSLACRMPSASMAGWVPLRNFALTLLPSSGTGSDMRGTTGAHRKAHRRQDGRRREPSTFASPSHSCPFCLFNCLCIACLIPTFTVVYAPSCDTLP
jgi:hypothetical protein